MLTLFSSHNWTRLLSASGTGFHSWVRAQGSLNTRKDTKLGKKLHDTVFFEGANQSTASGNHLVSVAFIAILCF